MQYTPKGKAASTEHSIWGRNQKLFLFSSIQMSSGRGKRHRTLGWRLCKHSNYLISLLFVALFERCWADFLGRKCKTRENLKSTVWRLITKNTLIHTCRIQIVLTIRDISEGLQSNCNQLSGWTDKLCLDDLKKKMLEWLSCEVHLLANLNIKLNKQGVRLNTV